MAHGEECRTDAQQTIELATSREMWGKAVDALRRAGPRKIAIFTVVAVIAVIFAYGNNSTNDAANGMAVTRASAVSSTLARPNGGPRPVQRSRETGFSSFARRAAIHSAATAPSITR